MGPVGRICSIGHFLYRFSIVLLYIPLLLLYFYPRYRHNIPYTKIRGFGMQILCSPIFGIPSMHFSLSNILQIPKRSFWAGYLPACVCGRGKPLPPRFLRLSISIVSLRFLVSLSVFLRKTLFVCILVQTQYGTCNSISYVLKYCCLWLLSS